MHAVDGASLVSVVFCRSIDTTAESETYHGVLDAYAVTIAPHRTPMIEVTTMIVKLSGQQPAHGWRLTVDADWPDGTTERVSDGDFPLSAEPMLPATLTLSVDIPTATAGTTWFALAVNGQPLARVPFQVVHHRVGFPA